MLRLLRVKNFAVISELELEFGAGLSVFTGETGAGKSILVEALGFLLGERGSVDWLRAGAAKLEVCGAFDGDILIRRELDENGKSKAWINDRPVALSALRSLGAGLADFHGQHEHQALLDPSMQLELLDEFGDLSSLRMQVAGAYGKWRGFRAELDSLELSEEERLRRMDLYRFQVSEIDDVSPKPGEEVELEAELPRLKNAARLTELAARAYDRLYEGEGSAAEVLAQSERALEDITRLDPSMEEGLAALRRSHEALQETVASLGRYRDVDARPERLEEILSRQNRIARLKKKYGATIEEVLAYRDRIRSELQGLENRDERLREISAALAEAESCLAGFSEELHKARVKAAKRLGEKATVELKELGMPSARLSVEVEMEEGQYSASGADRAEFLIAPNPGEGLKPLRAIASGGELSRSMLALKALVNRDRVGLLVFDEVDSGVGASVGLAVGRKLAQLASSRQVFCVTHLPQVACFAGAHFHVAKSISGGRTVAHVERLSKESHLDEIARMLGGRKVTETSRRHAKELLESIS